jgi:UDP-GlcNAc:undecaprenyl-phosphate/decaprenyl-phosphate GlcNAc-1-phosphate transferase
VWNGFITCLLRRFGLGENALRLNLPEPPQLQLIQIIPLIVASAVLSALLTYLIVRFPKWHLSMTGDATSGIQKFHVGDVPRIGGVPIAGAFLAALAAVELVRDAGPSFALTIALLTAVPVFLIGLMEDLTKRVEPIVRLGITLIAATVVTAAFELRLTRLDIPMIDGLLTVTAISSAFTAFAIVGVSNAFNIIDGYNGLVGLISVMVLSAIASVAWAVGDAEIMVCALCLASAVLGFLVWNYPNGKIFAGDGGAYFIGFVVAVLGVLLVERHSQVSPWFPLALVVYPVWETLFTIYRRKILRGHAAMRPDAVHLHTLVYRRLCRWAPTVDKDSHKTLRNAYTSPYLWILTLPFMLLAVLFWDNTFALQSVILGFTATYLAVYWRIVRFRAPQWMVISYWTERRRTRAARIG